MADVIVVLSTSVIATFGATTGTAAPPGENVVVKSVLLRTYSASACAKSPIVTR